MDVTDGRRTDATAPADGGGIRGGVTTPTGGGGVMRRLNMFTGIVAGVILAVVVWLISHHFLGHSGHRIDLVNCLTLIAWNVGFLIGIGAFVAPARWLVGRDLNEADREFMAGAGQGKFRYLRFCTDHKVVGVQYLVLGMTGLGIGGVMAMIIRTQLMHPGNGFLTTQTYNAVIGLHGLIMILSLSIIVAGPFGNFIMPIMIGARDMAFPRLNALSIWMLFAAVLTLLCAFLMGGIDSGWSLYAPLSVQGPSGFDAVLVAVIFWTISSGIGAVNFIVTILGMRTRGMRWRRLPIFVWSILATSILSLLFLPAFQAAMLMLGLDRSIGTSFYVPQAGGSVWLYENVFWIFGHPEVYLVLLPAVGALLELVPVFSRKPLFSYNGAVLGIVGIMALSALVWAHHMFTTGWAPALNGGFMITTELISVPTGLIFFVMLGTLWRGRIWTRTSMLFAYAFLWDFLIGGVSGVYLGDVPANYQLHGSLFVVAHFHFTLVGGALMGFFAAFYYWFPKLTGRYLDETLGKISFWMIQIGFNLTFLFMFYVGLQGEPRRVADYSNLFAVGNFVSTWAAYLLGAGMLVFLADVIRSLRGGEAAPADAWGSRTLEWQVPTPVPLENFEEFPAVESDPYGFGEPYQPVAHPVGAATDVTLEGPEP